MGINFRGLTTEEIDQTIWRYLTFQKFISLLTYQALWFSKLNILQDQYEGKMPIATKRLVKEDHQKWKRTFNSLEFHRQIDAWADENENHGRDLLVVNCWFLEERESKLMWERYAPTRETVAITSTVRRLSQSVCVSQDPKVSQVGKVKYVDFHNHTMSSYEAAQGCERAFLKDLPFQDENEIRFLTMNFKSPYCVSMEGIRFTAEQTGGKDMNNSENPGIYICANMKKMIENVVLAKDAPNWFELLVRRIVDLSGLHASVKRSELEGKRTSP